MKTRVQLLRDQLNAARREHLRSLSPAFTEPQLRRRVSQLKALLRMAEAEEAREKRDGRV